MLQGKKNVVSLYKFPSSTFRNYHVLSFILTFLLCNLCLHLFNLFILKVASENIKGKSYLRLKASIWVFLSLLNFYKVITLCPIIIIGLVFGFCSNGHVMQNNGSVVKYKVTEECIQSCTPFVKKNPYFHLDMFMGLG